MFSAFIGYVWWAFVDFLNLLNIRFETFITFFFICYGELAYLVDSNGEFKLVTGKLPVAVTLVVARLASVKTGIDESRAVYELTMLPPLRVGLLEGGVLFSDARLLLKSST